MTVIAAVPLFPSLEAVMVADPAPTPATSPLPFTVAMAVLLLPHVTTRPASALPLASRGVAVSCPVCPGVKLSDAGLTLTDATGATARVTVIAAVPSFPSLDAVIVVAPAPVAVTNPLLVTVATPVLPLVHAMPRPDNAFPLASRGVAVSCTVWPVVRLDDPGVTITDATGAAVWVTVIAAVPSFPSLDAVIVVAPAPVAVTNPLPVTVATAVLPLVHAMPRPDNALPLASRRVAVSCTV